VREQRLPRSRFTDQNLKALSTEYRAAEHAERIVVLPDQPQ